MRRILILLLLPVLVSAAGLQIAGSVIRSDSKEPVAYSAVILRQGTNMTAVVTSDENGTFKLEEVPPGKYSLTVKQTGFYNETLQISGKGGRRITIYLVPEGAMILGEIEVIGERQKSTVSKNILPREVRQRATTTITGDPLSVLPKMPGIESTGMGMNTGMGASGRGRGGEGMFGGGGIGVSVRGGRGSENAALLDDIQVPYPYHSFMPDSVFIDDLISDLIIYIGVYSPRYGQAMSSLLDVTMDEAPAGLHGKVNFGLLNAYLTLKGASRDGRWSFIGGIKRTHYDLIVPLFFDLPKGMEFVVPYYLDTHGRLRYQDRQDRVYLLWEISGEPGRIMNPTENSNSFPPIKATLNTWHSLVAAVWKRTITRSLFLEQSLDYGWTSNSRHVEFRKLLFRNDSQENYLRYKTLADWTPYPQVTFRPGLEILHYNNLFYTNFIRMSYTNAATLTEVTTNLVLGRYRGTYTLASGFLDTDITFLERLHFSGGLRFGYADYIHKPAFDPRVTLSCGLGRDNKAYLAWGYLTQFTSDPTTLARLKPDRRDLSVPGVHHFVAGTRWTLPGSFSITAEGYHKRYLHQLTAMSNAQRYLDTSGSQKHVYGAELFLQKMPDAFPVSGWIGFTRFTAWQRDDQGPFKASLSAWESPDSPVDRWYVSDSADYKVDITAIWEIAKLWSLTAEFNWHSGAPYTPITGSRMVISGPKTNILPVFGAYNSRRFEDGHQLNLKLEKRGKIFGCPGGFYLQVNNAYNHKPVDRFEYSRDYTKKKSRRSFLGIYPILGFWMEW
jgi:hypothetical protein